MPGRTSALATLTAALLVCLGGSPAPAQTAEGSHVDRTGVTSLTGAEWHRLHPLLCHTAGDHQLR